MYFNLYTASRLMIVIRVDLQFLIFEILLLKIHFLIQK